MLAVVLIHVLNFQCPLLNRDLFKQNILSLKRFKRVQTRNILHVNQYGKTLMPLLTYLYKLFNNSFCPKKSNFKQLCLYSGSLLE